MPTPKFKVGDRAMLTPKRHPLLGPVCYESDAGAVVQIMEHHYTPPIDMSDFPPQFRVVASGHAYMVLMPSGYRMGLVDEEHLTSI